MHGESVYRSMTIGCATLAAARHGTTRGAVGKVLRHCTHHGAGQ